MSEGTQRQWIATLSLTGTIIGVGIFGMPYAIAQIGVWPTLVMFVILGGIQLLQHLFFAEAAIACDEPARLVGLVTRYLGRRWRTLAGLASTLGYWSSLVAYIIVGGTFLHLLLGDWLGGSPDVYRAVWVVVGALVVAGGLKAVAEAEIVGTIALLAALVAIFALVLPEVTLANYVAADARDMLLPYGVILFSLSGLNAVPQMEDLLPGQPRRFRRAVVAGTALAWLMTLAFGLIVYGTSGAATAEDAVAGLRAVLGAGGTIVVAAFGFLAVATSYFTIALALKETFEMDYGWRGLVAWFACIAPPIVVWVSGVRSFVEVIAFSGAVFGGVVAVLVAALYLAVRRRRLVTDHPLAVPAFWAWLSIVILSVGAVVEIAAAARNLL